MKRSYTLTKTQVANPKGLGAKPRKTGYSSNAYPTLPTTLEETVATGPSRTEKWVQENKHTPEAVHNKGGMTKPNAHDDAAGQSPDYNQCYNQSMGWLPFMPQYNAQSQYGYQANGTGPGTNLLSRADQQNFFMSPNPGPVQYLGANRNLARRPTEEDRIEEIKKKLEKERYTLRYWLRIFGKLPCLV